MKTEPRIGWWFSAEMKLPHGDDRPIVFGQKLSIKGKFVMCENALHGSFDPFDALQYAPGPLLHKCLFEGARIEDADKLGSRSRTVLATRYATPMLRQFAREQALSVIDLWDAPEIMRRYLETGDENIRAAAGTAARVSARAAAGAAAGVAAGAAAWEAAGAAAWEAVGAATWAEARAAARKRFNELVADLFAEGGEDASA